MMKPDAPMRPLVFERHPEAEMRRRAQTFYEALALRRTVRHFSAEPIPVDVLETCVAAAGTAPSGAHKQPWTFVVITDPALKRTIRVEAEQQERAFYGGRAPDRWLRDLEPLATDAHKPMLETAPALIAIFAQKHGEAAGAQHYYVQESVGIAVGMLLTALHTAGLATLTHTPSPMGFLGQILGRPNHERAFLLIPVGYPAEGCQVPDIERKGIDEILVRRY
jgi:nitroreductase